MNHRQNEIETAEAKELCHDVCTWAFQNLGCYRESIGRVIVDPAFEWHDLECISQATGRSIRCTVSSDICMEAAVPPDTVFGSESPSVHLFLSYVQSVAEDRKFVHYDLLLPGSWNDPHTMALPMDVSLFSISWHHFFAFLDGHMCETESFRKANKPALYFPHRARIVFPEDIQIKTCQRSEMITQYVKRIRPG